jgi:hypothetical protein
LICPPGTECDGQIGCRPTSTHSASARTIPLCVFTPMQRTARPPSTTAQRALPAATTHSPTRLKSSATSTRFASPLLQRDILEFIRHLFDGIAARTSMTALRGNSSARKASKFVEVHHHTPTLVLALTHSHSYLHSSFLLSAFLCCCT